MKFFSVIFSCIVSMFFAFVSLAHATDSFASNTFVLQPASEKTDAISGVVTMSKEIEKTIKSPGVLFIIVKKPGGPKGPPIATMKIDNPKNPQPFKITSANTMLGGKLEGSLTVVARYSPSGDPMDKSGPEGSDPNAPTVELGKSGLKIELKAK